MPGRALIQDELIINSFDLYSAPEICIELGSHLKQQRLFKPLSQEDLAHKANLGVSTVQHFEQGNGGNLENFIRLIITFGLIDRIESLLLQLKII